MFFNANSHGRIKFITNIALHMKIHTILFTLFLTSQVVAQKATLPAEVIGSIQSRIEVGITPGIVVGIIDENGPQYYSFGTKTSGGEKVNEHSIYEIGSISKLFTATLLAENIVKGKMKADDPVSGYLPKDVKVPVFPGGGQPITLGTLSDHTSSLPRLATNMPYSVPDNPYSDYTVELLYDFLNEYTLTREVGSQFEYSNLAVGMLGFLLAEYGKTTYEALLNKTITAPLKMKETAVTLSDKMKQNLAPGHSMGEVVSNWDITYFPGMGGIRSSVHDMLLFLSANMELSKSQLTPAMKLAQTIRHTKSFDGVGLGWLHTQSSSGDILWHNGGTGGYRAFLGFIKETGKGVVVLTNSDAGVDDIGLHLLDPATQLEEIKAPLTPVLKKIIDTEGADGLFEKYKALKAAKPDYYAIDEGAINTLGYAYLTKGQTDAALEVFNINVVEFPQSFNVYDSYGEALMKMGQQQEAIDNYKKSLELNPGNTNGIDMLAKMGVGYKVEEVKVDEQILQTYTGTYEIVPGFNIVITRDGSRLFGQATGQGQFELFPKSTSEFYLKVVEARVEFKSGSDGIMGMTLYQNGQVMPGKRI
jgi:CubicO group peptidase (beta-lactamase class C family)